MSSKNNENGVIELFGGTFQKVEHGLDEEQIVSFVKQLIDERDALIKGQEHFTSLTRLHERTISEADDLAEEIKKEAEEQAQVRAKAILGEAEEQAQQIIEEKRGEAVALAQREVHTIKANAEKEIEALLEKEIAALQAQLRDTTQRLCDEMLSQAESFKQQAAVFKEKSEEKLSELEMVTGQVSVEDSQVIADTDIPVASEAIVRVGEVDQLSTSEAQAKAVASSPAERAAECKEWVVLEILPPRDQDEIESIVTYLNDLDEVATADLKYFTDKTVIEVALDKSISLVKTLLQLPQVEKVQEVIEDEQEKIQIALSMKAEIDRARDVPNQKVTRIAPAGSKRKHNWLVVPCLTYVQINEVIYSVATDQHTKYDNGMRNMNVTSLTGKVQTVLGIIDADDLGVTLPHEHLITDLSMYFTEPTETTEKSLAYQPVTLENLYWVQRNHFNNIDDLRLCDEQLAIKEALLYKWAGGDTIVELSSIGLARDPLALARISRATGLNVIMGSGYYMECAHPPELTGMTKEEITEEIVRDIMIGVGNTRVRAGIIGEIGCSLPLKDSERKVLRASATAQQRTGAALNIHPTFNDDSVLEIIKILGDAGADLSRTIIDHLHAFSLAIICEIADAGCYIEFDNLGYPKLLPSSYPVANYPTGPLYIPLTEPALIIEIKQLLDSGYLNQILISHDVCFKHCYTTYGGAGYAHILRDVVPIMLQRGGISEEQIHTIMVENPKRILSFAPMKD